MIGLDRGIVDNGQRIGDYMTAINEGRNAMEITMIELDMGNIDIPLGRNGKYGTMRVDSDAFQRVVHVHIYNYGLRQILNDAMADKTDDDGNQLPTDQIVAKAQKRLDALYAGDLRVRRAGDAEPADPVDAEIARSVKAIMHAAYKDETVPKGTKNRLLFIANKRREAKGLSTFDTIQAAIDEYMSKSPKAAAIRREAERTVKMRADAGDDLI